MESLIVGQPIMIKGDLCIFETEKGYDLYKRGEGEMEHFDKLAVDTIGQPFWNGLLEQGWERIQMSTDDDEVLDD